MKRLTLIRHAQADSDLPDQSDWERPLTRRGQNDAAEMARRAKQRKLKPDLILCSSAKRTRETAEAFVKLFGLRTDQVAHQSELYLADSKHLLECIRGSADVNHVMVIAHNPGISEFAQWVAQDYEIDGMTTCAMFTVEIEIKHWSELSASSGINADLDYPQRSR
jgi:phosphohistidine phosphatase